LKTTARRLLEEAVERGERIVTNAGVLREILHRYVAIDRRDVIQPAVDVLLGVVDDVLLVERTDVERAKQIVIERRPLSARDSLHVAVMHRHGISRIMSFDADFDAVPALTRIS
jgi:uncharacterized protein